VGYVFPVASVYRTVAETARAAACEDTRFLPVTIEEAPGLDVSLSILSPLRVIKPEEVEIGVHGLVVFQSGRRGLLLPQVPVEHHWDRVTFIQQTCRKAGLPLDAWQRGATLEAFTAGVRGSGGKIVRGAWFRLHFSSVFLLFLFHFRHCSALDYNPRITFPRGLTCKSG
jgi:AMMECR1 domain-containing protein